MYNIFSRRNCIFHINNSDLKKINTSTYKPLFYMKKKEKKKSILHNVQMDLSYTYNNKISKL
ncbi:hypothetical protein PFAG_03790 [Plasmodium falciparum Santa Lucia]|uniref:Uncharacterized protein n=4 Tax=Plasmodium falciparum TaxID=5833 RepID=W4J1K9_PLAFP|nr:hypothetical protein PFUGPA_01849 [Plasmodium falciparum Palo Alto/Uganda]ETW60446.1 hypothetical protein PFMC_03725 [Plasmodium falciparum CAMP/Malaysia]EUR69292.1 hypothetical protein PFBG_03844 [Plasmodium falciparum 7G8]EUT82415.1 hypothetical protein PFAG_03790 [Plasmodium falciparum Santa Lucia]